MRRGHRRRSDDGKLPKRSLTLTLEEHDLHPVEGERLSEAVSYRVLLLLENLGHLKWRAEQCSEEEEEGRGGGDERGGERKVEGGVEREDIHH